MASGILNLNSNKSNLESRIVWSSSSNGSSANTSNVYAELQARRNDGYTTKGTWNGTLFINGDLRDFSNPSTSVSSDWVTMISFTVYNVAHNDDGSGTCLIWGNINGPSGTSMSGAYAEGEVYATLDKIARKSSVTCADGNIGSATTININRASSSFTHTLKYSFGSLSETIATKTANTSIGWMIPTSFYAQIPNATNGKGTITCDTYDGDTLIGTSTCTFNAFVINSEPTISATIVDTNETTTALTGDNNKLVKYFSNAEVKITATAKNSASIKSQKVSCEDGKSATTSTSTLNKVESGKFTISAIDSRGLSTSKTIEKTMINYIKLALTEVTLARPSTTSNTINATIKGNYFNASFGAVANTLELKWRYRLSGGEWNSYNVVTPTISGNTFSYSASLGSGYNYKEGYEFEIIATDKLMPDKSNKVVTQGKPIVDIGKDDVIVNGEINGLKTICYKIANMSSNSYFKLGRLELKSQTRIAVFTIYGGAGQNAEAGQNSIIRIYIKKGWQSSASASNAFGTMVEQFANPNSSLKVYVMNISSTIADVYVYFPYSYFGGYYTVSGDYDSYEHIGTGSSTAPTEGTSNPVGYTTFNTRGVKTLSSQSHSNYGTNNTYVPDMSFIAYWNGAHDSGNNSNLTYCYQGTIQAKPTSLYDNSSGSNGTITLSQTAANFSYLEIFFGDSKVTAINSVKVFSPNGKTVSTTICTKSDTDIRINTRRLTISGNTITPKDYQVNFIPGGSKYTVNEQLIYKVIGYK